MTEWQAVINSNVPTSADFTLQYVCAVGKLTIPIKFVCIEDAVAYDKRVRRYMDLNDDIFPNFSSYPWQR